MLLEQMNWMQVEEYLKKDDRIVLVTGATEVHGYSSLATDTQVAWEPAKAACEREGVLLAPAIPYGPSHFGMAYPGTISITPETYMAYVRDVLGSLVHHGFKRILIVNGHGTNAIITAVIEHLVTDRPDLTIKFRSWYLMPKTAKRMEELGGHECDHAGWFESFPWINQPVEVPDKVKPHVDFSDYYTMSAKEIREFMGDGVAGGAYRIDEKSQREFFQLAVDEIAELLREGWDKTPPELEL
jgi:creatinine amidohydrolase